jgi:hypothetical protein
MIPVSGGTIAGVVVAFVIFGIILSGPLLVIMFAIRIRGHCLFRNSPVVTWNPWGIVVVTSVVTLVALLPTNALARIEYEDTLRTLLEVWSTSLLSLAICLLVPWRAIFTDEPWIR